MQYEAFHSGFWATGTFWVTVAVLLFLLVFGARILRGINSGLDNRAAGIRGALEEAQRLRREAEVMLQEAERRQKDAIETARRLMADASTRAARLSAELAREAAAANERREAVVTERIAAAQAARSRKCARRPPTSRWGPWRGCCGRTSTRSRTRRRSTMRSPKSRHNFALRRREGWGIGRSTPPA